MKIIEFINKYKNVLNTSQLEAVTHKKGPLLIVASAGTGKTRVITYRNLYLIKYQKISPSKILTITFTNKAADEMKERIYSLVSNTKKLNISTFHSWAYRILREEYKSIKFQKNFVIMDESDSISIIKRLIKEEKKKNNNYETYNPENIYRKFSYFKNIEFLKVIEFYHSKNIECLKNKLLDKNEIELFVKYQNYLNSHNSMDFDDLMLYLYLMLEYDEDLYNKYQNAYSYILIDEFQDTNEIQYQIIKKLSIKHRNLTCCGDDDQGIYGFRGATIKNIMNFETDFPEAKIVFLTTNYRSTSNIVKGAVSLIEKNKYRREKNIISANKNGDKIIIHESDNPEAEANFVYKCIYENLYKQGIKYKDIAVLYRNNYQSRIIEELFTLRDVPYKVWGGYNFYEREEIKDIIAYIKFLFNPDDEVSLLRIINIPPRRIGPNTVKKVIKFARDNDITIIDLLNSIYNSKNKEYYIFNYREIINLSEFFKIYLKFNNEIFKKKNIYNTIYKLINDINYYDYLKEHFDNKIYEKKVKNVESFLNSIISFENRKENNSIYDFISRLSLLQNSELRNKEDGVNLLTIHSAKGLEFRIVIIIGAEEGIIPKIDEKVKNQFKIEEERRLFYVAMTRAIEKLYISYCKTRMKYRKKVVIQRSRFIDELSKSFIEYDHQKISDRINLADFAKLKSIIKNSK